MLKSMTGYGRAQQIIDGRDITVELKGINHRFFEFNPRVPRSYGYLEDAIKTLFQSRISRGKIDVNISIHHIDTPTEEVAINTELARNYLTALRDAATELGISDDLKISHMTRFNDIFTIQKKEEDEEAIVTAVKQVAAEALERFVLMRQTEGAKLKEDLLEKLASIESAVSVIEKQSAVMADDYRNRLYHKLTELLQDAKIDEQRILTEAAIFAEKTAVDEETVRLKSHIAQFRQLLESDTAVGRKLDFLIQEFNREANTIGSKIQNVEITKIVVEIKSDIEKIREQIQNIE